MTNEELDAIEYGATYGGYPKGARDSLHALIAEVRRLRGLIREAQSGTEGMCPWCLRYPIVGHFPECPIRELVTL